MARIVLSEAQYDKLMGHLVPSAHEVEEVAFLFVEPVETGQDLKLVCHSIWCCSPEELDHQSAYHISLKDEAKAALLKRAHDLGCALVEIHSHVGPWHAEFSASDYAGFEEFVPHVRWRLKGTPYAAIVVTRRDMDAFVWQHHDSGPQRLEGLEVNGTLRAVPNGRSPLDPPRRMFDVQI